MHDSNATPIKIMSNEENCFNYDTSKNNIGKIVKKNDILNQNDIKMTINPENYSNLNGENKKEYTQFLILFIYIFRDFDKKTKSKQYL